MLKPLSLAAMLASMALPAAAATPLSRTAPLPAACALPATPMDLATVARLVLCRHPDARTAWLNAEVQAARVDAARAPYRPTVEATLGQSHAFGDSATPGHEDRSSAGVALGWLLYDFGARDAGKAQAERSLQALQATQDGTLQEVLRQAVDAYYQWFATEAALSAARESETAATETLRAASVRQRVGVATREDLLQAQTSLSQARLSVLSKEGEQQVARGRLAVLLGLPAPSPLVLATPAALPDRPALPALAPFIAAAAQHPDLVAQQQRVAASDAALEQARASHRPDLRLSASQDWTQDQASDSAGGSVGLRLNIPLYTGGQRAADIREAEAQQELARTALEQQRQQVSQQVWEAWQALRTATAALAATQDLVSAAEESQRAALARYQAGLGDLINVLNAQSALADARQQFVKARYDWARARISLARASGALGYAALETAGDLVP